MAGGTTEDPAPFAEQLCRLLVRKWGEGSDAANQSQLKFAKGLALRGMEPFVTATPDQLSEILRDLNQLADKFEPHRVCDGQDNSKATTGESGGPAPQGAPRMADVFAIQHDSLILELNQAIERRFVREGRGLREILLGPALA